MTEVREVALKKLALDEVHRGSGAVMVARDGWSLPASYGDELFEYATVRERGAGLIDLSARGRLHVSGSEAVAFLNGLITNDMKTLGENHWMPAVFPNVQGRLIASVRVLRLADSESGNVQPNFIIDTEPATHDRVFQTIQKFSLAGDFHVTDMTGDSVLFSLQGKDARQAIASVLGATVVSAAALSVIQTDWQDAQVTLLRATETGADGFDLIVSTAHATQLWQALIKAGARPVGYDALEILRIEAGIPRYGQDMDDTTVVTETNLDDAVSYTKGCYVGQEIIARIKYRGHVAKKLRGLVFEPFSKVEARAQIKTLDDKEIGHITSAAYSPHIGQRVALGFLKYDYITAGTRVKGGDGSTGRVVELPFIHPQWQIPAEV